MIKQSFRVLQNEKIPNIPNVDVSLWVNKNLLSLINDFEDKKWRYEIFESFIWDNIILTALSQKERNALLNQSHTALTKAAKNLRLTDKKGDVGNGSELAEIALYGIMNQYYNALPAVPKIFYKQNNNDYAKGADSVHIAIEKDGDFSLWLGEAKFYNTIDGPHISKIINSIKSLLSTDKIKKENSIITNISDIDTLGIDQELKLKIKSLLSGAVSIDAIKPKLNVPILILHECPVTKKAIEINKKYEDEIIDSHKQKCIDLFSAQIDSLKEIVTGYSKIKFHLILFPVPDKKEIIKKFIASARHYRGNA